MQLILLLAFTTILTFAASAHPVSSPVQMLADKMKAQYVSPEKGAAIARRLRDADKRGAYVGYKAYPRLAHWVSREPA